MTRLMIKRLFLLMTSAILIPSVAASQTLIQADGGGARSYDREIKGSDIPFAESTINFYHLINGMEKNSPGTGVTFLRKNLNLDNGAAASYLRFILDSLDADAQFRRNERARLVCTRRNELTSEQELATALDQLDTSISLNLEKIVGESPSVLGPRQADVDIFVFGMRDGMVTRKPDRREYVTSRVQGGKNIGSIVSSLCD